MLSLETAPPLEFAHEPVIATLRAEIEEYGALVALFDEQQAAILSHEVERVVALSDEINRQALATRACRKAREAVITQLLPSAPGEKVPGIADLLPLLREPVRPLVEALKDEINRLVTHTRRRAVQNQMLMDRTLEPRGGEVENRLRPEAIRGLAKPTRTRSGGAVTRAMAAAN